MARLLIQPKPGQDVVSATLEAWAAAPFKWGESDCALSVLAYVEAATGRRYCAPHYRNKREAFRFAGQFGGLHEAAFVVMAIFGCAPTGEPVRGDVGLIDLPRIGLTCCLCLGDDVWAGRGDEQVTTARMTPVAAWRLPCRS